MTRRGSQVLLNFEPKRDSYGFTVRPQHLHRYREYADIYKEEEEERLQKWESFLEQQSEPARAHLLKEDNLEPADSEVPKPPTEHKEEVSGVRNGATEQKPWDSVATEEQYELVKEGLQEKSSSETKPSRDPPVGNVPTKESPIIQHAKSQEVQTWAEIRPSLNFIESMMSSRVKKRENMKDEKTRHANNGLPVIDEANQSQELSEDEDEDVFHDNEIVDHSPDASAAEHDHSPDASAAEHSPSDRISPESPLTWKEELEFLVRGGVPKDLRGEVWQAFVGVRTRRVESYYQDLLDSEINACYGQESDKFLSGDCRTEQSGKRFDLPEKWKKQIEKDLPRTFPGHPALNEKGRNALRRVLLAYARHNPSVGYCQAMNFFAGLLLLMMPEENAFWTLVAIIDDYFEDYFSQEMIESQVDQLVFEDLMRERFPKLVNHLEYLGVQVAWVSGPWFLSIFINMLPWESVLRVWDVLLFEGNRVMLLRTALALMDLYGPAIVTTKDAGDAITLMQTLAGSTFDSSQLVLTACMGFLAVSEDRLQELREKHRPAILASVEERANGDRIFKDPKGLATKLYSFKHDPESIVKEKKLDSVTVDKVASGEISDLKCNSTNMDKFLNGMTIDSEVESLPDLQEQVELCRLLEEKRSAVLRAEELEGALMEMVKQDNRRELSARVEQLEQEVAELKQELADKGEEEKAMLQVLMKVEQEQKVTEDARLFAEQDAIAQRYAVEVLQEKYEQAMTSLAQMEKRALTAESMLEATLQYESGQNKVSSSPMPGHVESRHEMPNKRTGLLSFGLGWRDRNKGKPSTGESNNQGSETGNGDGHTNGHQK